MGYINQLINKSDDTRITHCCHKIMADRIEQYPRERYYLLTECNGSECETWMFAGKYVILHAESEERWNKCFERLNRAIDYERQRDNDGSSVWCLHWDVQEFEITVLDKYAAPTYYMNSFNLVDVIPTLEDMERAVACDICMILEWYKGPNPIKCTHNHN